MGRRRLILLPAFLFAVLAAPLVAPAAASEGDFRKAARPASPQGRYWNRREEGVYKARLDANWIGESSQFWYKNDLPGEKTEYLLVDPEKDSKAPAFDHERLAAALSEDAGGEFEADKLPLSQLEFAADGASMSFVAQGAKYSCGLETYELVNEGDAPAGRDSPPGRRPWGRRRSGGDSDDESGERQRTRSPNGEWVAFVRDHNVFVRESDDEEAEQLSDDGAEGQGYGMLSWSPDSQTLVAFRITPGDDKEVHLLESSPSGGGRAELHSRAYPLPGDRLTSFELNVFHPEEGEHLKPEVDPIDLDWPQVVWREGGASFAYRKVDRGHQRLRVIRIDAKTGEATNLVDEKTDTFIWTAHTENLRLSLVNWLEESDELIYVSERDGWRHLYLVDAVEGGIKNAITEGEYVVRGVDRIDEENRQVWFHASGGHEGQDPYFVHYYRVDFDGSNLVELTKGNGQHSVQFSPDNKFLVDTYSRVDFEPVHELRRCDDGTLVRTLEEADISELEATDWAPLEPFHAKGRDGVTDIWGVIALPKDFDPAKKYPVIESIYAGPQGAFVPKSFRAASRYSSLTDLGFVVVQIDGMGTANRSKAFHDVCWHNLKDAGFPDRILWMKAAAKDRPYMDLERVGVYGGSAGGQNAAGAVLFHPEFYKVAVAGCGCHDNRMDKSSWNEQWMGYPVGPQYAECSNIDNAHRLEGRLMLIVGEMDNNVPPESTLRFVDALIKADKNFDFVFVPGAGHGMGGGYGFRRLQEFFVRHLLDEADPLHNKQSVAAAAP